MFAFAIFDNKESSLFCARDRFGEKPFHYYADKELFVFGSEIKQIFKYKKGFTIDYSLLQIYLDSGQIALDDVTYFKEVKALAPAHSLMIRNGEISIHKYWDIDLGKKLNLSSVEEYVEGFREKFMSSITKRLRSDVEVGSCLSGGIDSSSIVSAIATLAPGPFTTFSARFNDEAKDEGKWIKTVLDKSGVQNKEVYPDPSALLNEIEELLFHHEFPVGSSSQYAQWCVYRLAAKNQTKVLLDGQGADEYLGGYDHLKYYAIWQYYRDFKFARFLKERKYLHKNWNNQSNTGMLFLFDPILNMFGKRRSIFERGYTFKERLKFSTQHELGELLRYGDRSSMAFSVEVRLPFLNHELVEYVFSVPDEMIYHHGVTKYILRKSVEGVIPDAIFNRYDKLGFAPPQKKWVADASYNIANEKAVDFITSFSLKPSEDIFKNIVVEKLLKVFHGFESNG
jgi:asparagine synthase (glutamine-hydrolysing)